MIRILLFLSVLVSFSAQAQLYVLGQAGYAQLNQKPLAENEVFPVGMTFAGGIGMRKDFFEFEATFQKWDAEADIIHDSQDNKIIHSQSSLLLAFNFYFSKRIYARLGYGFHKVKQKFDDPMSDASTTGANEKYQIKAEEISDGIIFGGGFVIYDGKSISLYTQVENMSMSNLGATAWNGVVGFKYYTDN